MTMMDLVEYYIVVFFLGVKINWGDHLHIGLSHILHKLLNTEF